MAEVTLAKFVNTRNLIMWIERGKVCEGTQIEQIRTHFIGVDTYIISIISVLFIG